MENNSNDTIEPGVAPTTMPPAMTGNAAPLQSDFATPTQKRRSPKLLIAGIIAAILVVIGGVGALGYTFWYQNPDKVVHDAILNAVKAKTVTSTGTITYSDNDVTMDILLDSKSNEEGGGEINLTTKIAIDIDGTKQNFDANGSGRIVEDTLYIRVAGIKSIVEDMAGQSNDQIPDFLATIVEKFEGIWISIRADDYKDIDKTISDQQTCIIDLTKRLQTEDAILNEMIELYRDNQIITIDEKLGSRDINGVGSLGYKVAIDKDASVTFTNGLADTVFGKELQKCDEDINFKELTEDITSQTAESDDNTTIELWVSRFGHQLTQISMYGESDNDGDLNITLQPTFDKAVSVEAPSDATSLKTVVEEIQQALVDYYTELYSAQGTMPTTSDNGMDILQPAI